MHRFIVPKPIPRKPLENIVLPPPSPPDRGPKFQRIYSPIEMNKSNGAENTAPVESKDRNRELTPEEVRTLRRSLSPINGYKITNIGESQILLFKKTPEATQKQQRNEFLASRRIL